VIRFFRLLARSFVIAWVFFAAFVRFVASSIGKKGPDRDRLRGEILARALERLGATFVKLGQILATRPDVVPEEIARALARLQDNVPPAPFEEVEAVIEEELSNEAREKIQSIDPTPVAAASVAQVHRGVLRDGTVVAFKVQRRAAKSQIERDLALMSIASRVVGVLPGMRWMSIPGAVDRFAEALHAQLDFRLEAQNNRRIAANFATDDRIRVPRLYDDLCSPRVLTMQFVEGIKPTDVPSDRPALAQAGFRCIAQMVFVDGFVHADMHPGNVMFTREGEIFLIDLGLVAEIPDELRKPWVDTFIAVAACDGRTAARLFYEYSPEVRVRDYAKYEAEVVAHLDALGGRPLHELEVTEAVGGAMSILRRHRVQVDPTFTVVNLAMLVAEGVGKQLDPQFDVYTCAMPFLATAAMNSPPGKPPLRRAPSAAIPDTSDRA